jgi:predicted TPR repeat methyltransferase
MSGNFEQAKEFFVQGLAHYTAGRYLPAETNFAAALALAPGRPSVLTNLGATRLKLGKFQEAADLLGEALEKEPGNVEALGHLATALAELGQLSEALSRADHALSLAPALAPVWSLRGSLLKQMGRFEEAREAIEKAIANGADTELNRYYLASLTGAEVPAAPPRVYVESLFDGYADGFEAHLVDVLKYRAPDILVTELRRTGRRFDSALDLGCGTGLCGIAARLLVGKLDGVDLSANMVERAAARQVYDEVFRSDLVNYLDTTDRRYDLVLAADVFVYVGALDAVFGGVARVLEPGGVFCFSVEACEAEHDFVLRPSLRYAHSPGYIQKLAEQYRFEIFTTAEHPIREDQRTPIAGLFAWLVRR